MKFVDKNNNILLDTDNIPGGSFDISTIGYQTFQGNNIYVKSQHYHTGYVKDNGTMKSLEVGGYVDIPVTPGKVYAIHRKRVNAYDAWHFKDGPGIAGVEANIIANYSSDYSHTGKICVGDDVLTWVVCPAGATNMYFTAMLQGRDDSDDLIVYESGAFPKEGYLKYNPIIEPLRNKKWFAVGDSITEMNARTTNSRNGYVDKVQKRTGILAYNFGISGTGYRRYASNFYARVDIIPSDVDYITIYGSINDMFSSGTNFGELTDTVEGGSTTLCAYINSTLNKIIKNCPNAKLGVITPIPAKAYGNDEALDTTNPGNRLEAYANKIKEICDYKGIPCLDLYHESNLHPELIDLSDVNATWSQFYYSTSMKAGQELDTNGVHPNEKGHELIADRIVEFLKSL